MRLEVWRPLWGLVERPDDVGPHLAGVAAAGYDGVAGPVQLVADADRLRGLLADHGLRFLPQVFTAGRQVADHVEVLRAGVRAAVPFAPRFVIAQSGRDSFDEAQAVAYFQGARAVEDHEGVPIAHELHRGRILFSPWAAARVLDRVEGVRLNLDLSHWVVVTERLLSHEAALLARCADAALHVDARVGSEQSPQVDPRLPDNARHLDAFESWWTMAWDAAERRGDEATSLMPEYGPPPYQALDAVGRPAYDLAEVNDWMAERQRRRFAERVNPC